MIQTILYRLAPFIICFSNNWAMYMLFTERAERLHTINQNSKLIFEQHIVYLVERNNEILQNLEISPLVKLTHAAIPILGLVIYSVFALALVHEIIIRCKVLLRGGALISSLSSLKSIGNVDSPDTLGTLDSQNSFDAFLIEKLAIIEELRQLKLAHTQTYGITPYTENSVAYQLTSEAFMALLST